MSSAGMPWWRSSFEVGQTLEAVNSGRCQPGKVGSQPLPGGGLDDLCEGVDSVVGHAS